MRNTQKIADGAYQIYYGNFYKYLSIDAAIATLKSGKLKYSSPKTFNDPLDSSERFIFIDSDTDHLSKVDKEYIDKIAPENNLSETKKDVVVNFINLIHEGYNQLDPTQKLKTKQIINRFLLQPDVREEIKKMKVCCFSRNYKLKKSSLMWSHYAENHSGICLEFNIKHFAGTGKLTENLFVPFVITYHSSIESKTIIPENGYHNDWLLKKLNIWEYEQEVRILRKTEEPKDFEFYDFPKSALKKIIFGYNTKPETINEIIEILKKDYDIGLIHFEKMGFDNSTFKLIPLKYDIENMKVSVLIDYEEKLNMLKMKLNLDD